MRLKSKLNSISIMRNRALWRAYSLGYTNYFRVITSAENETEISEYMRVTRVTH